MIRGTITFICDNCHERFEALDIEYQASALSAPMQCPKCGSWHTMPYNFFDKLFGGSHRKIYEIIWKKRDELDSK